MIYVQHESTWFRVEDKLTLSETRDRLHTGLPITVRQKVKQYGWNNKFTGWAYTGNPKRLVLSPHADYRIIET